MTLLETTPITAIPDRVAGDESRLTHIVKRGEDGKSADVILLEAGIFGRPVIALCGFTWIPQRDPEKFPVCTRCIAEYEKLGYSWQK